ncbi:response regulator [Paenibacillus sp. P25]|nr:response regulator [Paenibacillus sp. P25]
MYKILLVDDEAIVREAIKERINWQEHGFECVGDCENGLEAVELVERFRPDIVLTDICMPFMDGLELTRYLSRACPATRVVILTGHEDFDYAQQAVKLKVTDYILKPITASELGEVLARIRGEMDAEAKRHEDLFRLRQQMNESFPPLKERFLERLVTLKLHPGDIRNKLEYYQIDLPGPLFTALVVGIDDFGQYLCRNPGADEESLGFAVFNIVQEIAAAAEQAGVVFRDREERIIALLSGGDEISLHEHAQTAAEEIRQSVEKYLKFTVTVGIGRTSESVGELHQSYRSALDALGYRLLVGKNSVIPISDMEARRADREGQQGEWISAIATCIRTGSRREMEKAIEDMIGHLKRHFTPIPKCRTPLQAVALSIVQVVQELGADESGIFGDASDPLAAFGELKTLDDMELWLKRLGAHGVRATAELRNNLNQVQIEKAVRYIKEHFHEEHVSLQAVCQYVHLSVSYFSTLFKQYTGKTFIEALTHERIEKAKELLKFSPLKTYQIAAEVGYVDPHYFSAIFKKWTGETPTEYRRQAARDRV